MNERSVRVYDVVKRIIGDINPVEEGGKESIENELRYENLEQILILFNNIFDDLDYINFTFKKSTEPSKQKAYHKVSKFLYSLKVCLDDRFERNLAHGDHNVG